jgi:hypothetical protein
MVFWFDIILELYLPEILTLLDLSESLPRREASPEGAGDRTETATLRPLSGSTALAG